MENVKDQQQTQTAATSIPLPEGWPAPLFQFGQVVYWKISEGGDYDQQGETIIGMEMKFTAQWNQTKSHRVPHYWTYTTMDTGSYTSFVEERQLTTTRPEPPADNDPILDYYPDDLA